jgi:hypothetical protein
VLGFFSFLFSVKYQKEIYRPSTSKSIFQASLAQ